MILRYVMELGCNKKSFMFQSSVLVFVHLLTVTVVALVNSLVFALIIIFLNSNIYHLIYMNVYEYMY